MMTSMTILFRVIQYGSVTNKCVDTGILLDVVMVFKALGYHHDSLRLFYYCYSSVRTCMMNTLIKTKRTQPRL